MNRWLPFAFAGLVAATVQAHDIQKLSMQRPEGARTYYLSNPAAAKPGKKPLIILLHGHTGSAKQLLGQGIGAAPLSHWLDIAERESLIVIAPEGVKGDDNQQGWNDCRSDAVGNPHTDDVGLVTALIDEAVAKYDADPARVFAMGMSNGAMMSFRLAADIPGKLAGFGAVSGSMAAKSRCQEPKTPISALIISGTADPLVPYSGGNVGFKNQPSRGSVIGIEAAADFYRRLDKLPLKPAMKDSFAHHDDADPTRAHRARWGADAKAPQVELITIEGGGHVEPSESQRIARFYARIVGPQNGDLEAAEEAWAFFKDKVRKP